MIDTGAYDTWRALADKALAGAPFEMLRTPVPDGGRALTHPLDPLILAKPATYAGRAVLGRWDVVQRVDWTQGAAPQAREDLENGATALALVFAGAPSSHGRGLTADSVEALDAALKGVRLDGCPLYVEPGAFGLEALALLAALARRRGTAPAAIHVASDPFAVRAATGLARAARDTAATLAETVRGFGALGLAGTAFAADGRVAAEAGASPAEELAFALVDLHATVTLLDSVGVPPLQSLPVGALCLSASQEQIPTIAKLRAARALHRLYSEAFGLDLPVRLHVTTLNRMLAFSDPQTNLLRLAIAAFSAGVGGADALTVLPFDAAATPFGRRMARNLQTILLEESHVDAMADPGAGSGAIEAYTEEIARAAWQIFQEHAATPPAALLEGPHPMAAGILACAAALDGERTIVGVTKHPPSAPTHTELPPAPTLALAHGRAAEGTTFAALAAAAEGGATLADLVAAFAEPHTHSPAPLAPTRASAAHES